MPAKFGAVSKAFVRKDAINELALDLHLLTIDENGYFAQATATLIQNVKNYLKKYRMLTDAVNIMQTDIINLRVDFGVVISPDFNRNEVLVKCLSVLKEALKSKNMQQGQPIIFSKLNESLQKVVGVVSVYDIRIKNVHGSLDGLDYSDNYGNSVKFDVQAATQSGILYCPENAIFQVKFPGKDISGESK